MFKKISQISINYYRNIANILHESEPLKKIIHNSGWLFLDKGIRIFLGLIVGAWVARYLGPSDFGRLTYFLAFIAIFQAIANIGADGIVVRDIAINEKKAGLTLGTVFSIRVFSGFICWVLVFLAFITFNKSGGEEKFFVLILASSLVFQAFDVIDLWFQSQSQSRLTVYSKLISYIFTCSLKLFCIYKELSLLYFILAFALEPIFNSLAIVAAYSRFRIPQKLEIKIPEIKRILIESWPYMLSTLSIIIYMRIDQIMIGNILGDKSLGIYSAVLPISGIWNIIPVVICTSISPYLAKKKIESDFLYNEFMLKIFRFFWVISASVVLLTFCFSEMAIKVLYGPSYKGADFVLNIYVLTNIPIFLGVAQSLWLLNEKKPKILIVQTIVGAFISIALNLILLPMLGLSGAAISAVMAQLISAVLINSIICRKLFLLQLGIRPRLTINA